MEEYLIIIFRTCFIYVFILIIFRLMGKREVGELSVIDLVVSILIAEVAAFALDDVETPLINAILPIIMLFFYSDRQCLFFVKKNKKNFVI